MRAPPLSWRLSSHLLHPERRGSMGHGRQAKGASWQAKQHPEAHRWRGEGHPLPVVTALTPRGAAGLQVHGQARLPLAEKLTLQGEVARPSESQPARCSPDGGFPWPGDTAHCGTEPGGRTAPRDPSARAPGGERVKRTHSTVMSPHLGSPEESLSLLAVAAGSPSPSAGAAPSRLSASGAGDPPAGPSSTPAPRTGHLGLAGAALRSSTRSLPSGWWGTRTPLCSAGPPVGRDRCPGKALGSSSSHDCHRPLTGHS